MNQSTENALIRLLNSIVRGQTEIMDGIVRLRLDMLNRADVIRCDNERLSMKRQGEHYCRACYGVGHTLAVRPDGSQQAATCSICRGTGTKRKDKTNAS